MISATVKPIFHRNERDKMSIAMVVLLLAEGKDSICKSHALKSECIEDRHALHTKSSSGVPTTSHYSRTRSGLAAPTPFSIAPAS